MVNYVLINVLKMFPLPLHIYFEIAAFLTSVIFWYKIKHTRLRWFLPFLLFIVVIELYGRYIRKELHQPNAWLYNISVPVEYIFYAFIFWFHFKTKFFQQVTAVFLMLFPVFVLTNIFFIQGFQNFNTNILKAGSFSMILLSCLYFVELLQQEKETRLLKEPMFWIATGVFLFNTGEFFYTLFSDYLIENHLDKARHIFSTINNKLIWVLYTCLAISFLCTEKRPQKI
jgi:dipeptide/tripeptide permease